LARRRVLAIAEDASTLDAMATALAAAAADVDSVLGLKNVREGTISQRYVFYGWDGNPTPLHDLSARLKPGAELCAIVPASSLAAFVELMRFPYLSHVLVRSEPMTSLTITALKLFTGDIFGIEKYLPPEVEVHLTRLRDYGGRSRAIDSVLAFAEAAGVRRQIRSAIGQVCEELLMNALYDAPVDDGGNAVFAEVDPHARLEAQSPRPVSIRYATTDQHFAVAVRDRFGTLEKAHILNYLEKCLRSPNQIDRKTYGAGLGLYLIANNAAQFIVNLAPGMASEVVCTFDRKGAKVPLKILSCFVHPGLAAHPAGPVADPSAPRGPSMPSDGGGAPTGGAV
jgi:hypothetical protein